MSNNIKDNDISIFKFLASQEFIKELVIKDMHPEEHNFLLSAHLLAIGFNTSGISDGSVKVEYSRINDENFFRPKSNFAFYTVRNGLIEDTNYFNRQSITFNHSMFRFRDTREFRDFCVEYFDKYSKIIDSDLRKSGLSIVDTSIKFRLSGKKRKSEEGQLHGYKSIVCSNPNVKSLLDAFILDKELSQNNHVKQKPLKL